MNTGIRFQRTRIAPTPSGYLHLGNALSMAVTVALARCTGARVLLRIDDLDQQRIKRAYVEDVFATLDYLEIPYDEGPRNYREYAEAYSQLHRRALYREALDRLRDGGMVFACSCSRSAILQTNTDGIYTGVCRSRALPLDTPDTSWRLNTNKPQVLGVKGLDGSVQQVTLPDELSYFVVRKKDGFPAYQLASVVDDHHFGVDLIVRGEDLWHSTIAQQYLAGVLGYEDFAAASFWHHLLLKDLSGDKLSKSEGATSVHYLRKQGKTKQDIYRLIGDMLGLETAVNNWRELGDALGVLPSS